MTFDEIESAISCAALAQPMDPERFRVLAHELIVLYATPTPTMIAWSDELRQARQLILNGREPEARALLDAGYTRIEPCLHGRSKLAGCHVCGRADSRIFPRDPVLPPIGSGER